MRKRFWAIYRRLVASLGPQSTARLKDLGDHRKGALAALYLAVLGPFITIFALERGAVEQLSDVFSPSSCIEPWMKFPRHGIGPLDKPFMGERIYPYGWLLLFILAIFLYSRTIFHFQRIYRAFGSDKSNKLHRLLAFPLPQDSLDFDGGVFLRMLVYVWVAPPAILLIGVTISYIIHWAIFPEVLALAFALSMILTLLNTVAVWGLASAIGVRSWWKLSLLIPYALLYVALFAPIRYLPDTGFANNAYRTTLPPTITTLGPTSNSRTLPLIFIACAGGGSRASLWSSANLVQMWRLPQEVPTKASGYLANWQRQRNELWKTLTPDEFRLIYPEETFPFNPDSKTITKLYFPSRLLLFRANSLSSVSGGSLAAAYFVQEVARRISKQRADSPASTTSPFAERAKAIADFFTDLDCQEIEKITSVDHHDRNEYLDELAEAWEKESKYVSNMSLNHLSAVIAGFAHPFQGRGSGIEDYWVRSFKWGKLGRERGMGPALSDLTDLESEGAVPHLVLNTTDAGTGGRVAITNLDEHLFQGRPILGLTRGLEDDGVNRQAWRLPSKFRPSREPRFDPAPGEVATFRQILPHENVSLVRAIRASANFPIGFPLLTYLVDGQTAPLELTDGGVLDNTGMDSVLALIRHESQEALRQRALPAPVLVFQIDSSELAVNPRPSLLDCLSHNLSSVKDAMWRAERHKENGSAAEVIEQLEAIFGPSRPDGSALNIRIPYDDNWKVPFRTWVFGGDAAHSQGGYVAGESGRSFAFYRVRLGENELDHVPTSWHLARSNRGKIYDMADSEIVRGTIGFAGKEAVRLFTGIGLDSKS